MFSSLRLKLFPGNATHRKVGINMYPRGLRGWRMQYDHYMWPRKMSRKWGLFPRPYFEKAPWILDLRVIRELHKADIPVHYFQDGSVVDFYQVGVGELVLATHCFGILGNNFRFYRGYNRYVVPCQISEPIAREMESFDTGIHFRITDSGLPFFVIMRPEGLAQFVQKLHELDLV